jgi:hypothetical protein
MKEYVVTAEMQDDYQYTDSAKEAFEISKEMGKTYPTRAIIVYRRVVTIDAPEVKA